MKRFEKILQDAVFSLAVFAGAYCANAAVQEFFSAPNVIPMVFVLGVFLISLGTDGYFWGILASLMSVIAVNFTFTRPYYAFDFSVTTSLISAVVTLMVAIMTGALTTQIKAQEKIRAETAREKMRANLLRAISHDLRTPLTSIYGSTSVVVENYDTLSKEQKLKLLEDVRADSQWLIRMVENLLSVTRIDRETAQLRKTPVVLEELVDAVLVKFRKSYPEQAVHVQIPEQFVSIPMDAILMEQVLFNLLENAVLHAEGMTELCLNVSLKGSRALFEVLDNGCGIPREKLENLFAGYLECSDTLSDKHRNNMGIGLSVCATIVKAHGGDLRAENRSTGGARFSFALATEETKDE